VSRLTSDPEEEAWLAYVQSIAAMDSFEETRLVQVGGRHRANLCALLHRTKLRFAQRGV